MRDQRTSNFDLHPSVPIRDNLLAAHRRNDDYKLTFELVMELRRACYPDDAQLLLSSMPVAQMLVFLEHLRTDGHTVTAARNFEPSAETGVRMAIRLYRAFDALAHGYRPQPPRSVAPK